MHRPHDHTVPEPHGPEVERGEEERIAIVRDALSQLVMDDTTKDALSPFGRARATVEGAPLGEAELGQVDAFWRACNYLALGMIYLQENPLLRERLSPEHVKTRMLGHWGASPASRACSGCRSRPGRRTP